MWVSGGLLAIRRGGDHRAWGDISAGILDPAAFLLSQAITVHFSSTSRAQCLHVLFAVTLVPLLQEEELTFWLCFFLFTVTISLDGHFLQNEVPELILMQNSSSRLPDLSITLLDSHNNRVTTELQNKNRQKYTANLKKLEAKDSGTWVCQVHSDSPLINQNISFAVKVLGMWQQNWNSHTGLGTSVPFSSWV